MHAGCDTSDALAFVMGDRVKLIVSYYAKPAHQQARHKCRRKPPGSRFVLSSETLRFVCYRVDAPGGAVIEDESGARWYCPADWLTYPQLAFGGRR